MKHVCRRWLTAFTSQPVLIDHIDRCQKQKATNIAFSWKLHIKFGDHHMKILLPIRVYADINVLFNLKIQQTWLCMPKALCIITKYYLSKFQLQ